MSASRNNFKGNDKPIDPDVKIPEAVRRASEAADAAHAAAYASEAPAPQPAPAPDTIVIAEPPPAQLPPTMVTQVGNPEPPTPPATPTEPTPAPVDENSWEHKFKSLQGRFNPIQQLNNQLTERVRALEDMVEELSRVKPTASAPQPPAPAAVELLTPKEIEEYGPEMIDVIRRAAREMATREVQTVQAQMQELQRRLDGTESTVVRSSKASMLAALDQQMPEWREVNMMPEFKSWLALPDPYFGAIRHNALTEAFEKCETNRVLAFFKGFVSELAATTPVSTETGPKPAATPPAKPSLESLAAPGRARATAGATPPGEKQIITTADINAFYAAHRRGDYRGREDEFRRLEQELFQAQREGRVVTS